MPLDPQAAALLAQLPPGASLSDPKLTVQQLRERSADGPLLKAFGCASALCLQHCCWLAHARFPSEDWWFTA